MSGRAFAALGFAGILLWGCGAMSEQINQQITGTMRIDDRPGARLPLRLQVGDKPCESDAIGFTTDSNGMFTATRIAHIGKLAVIVQKDTLCILEGQKWHAIWRGIYGPAPQAMTFVCNRNRENTWKCTMNGLESLERKA